MESLSIHPMKTGVMHSLFAPLRLSIMHVLFVFIM